MNQSSRAAAGMRGFTLTELMIVVSIVAILMAIGLPAYTDYARRAKRADATATLQQIMTLQERFFTDNNAYALTGTSLGFASATPESQEGYWTITFTPNAGATSVALTAAPRGTHTDPDCNSISLNSAGVRSATDSGNNASECWGGK